MATVLKVLEQSAHRALQTADILHEVMAYLDVNHDIPGCTHVCWAWFPVAICFRWKTIKKTLPLARLLGSIVFQGDTWVSLNTNALNTGQLIHLELRC